MCDNIVAKVDEYNLLAKVNDTTSGDEDGIMAATQIGHIEPFEIGKG